MENFDYPKLTIWITSTGRYDFLKETLERFEKYNTYPNIEYLIVESVPTEESMQVFNTPMIKSAETRELLEAFRDAHPDNCKLWFMDWPKLGVVYNHLMKYTSEYYMSLEDDCWACCDPHDHIVDAIKVLREDPELLGIRADLADETVRPDHSRFQSAGRGMKRNPHSNYLFWEVCSGGAQIVDTTKVRNLGGFFEDHELIDYARPEFKLQEAMRAANMYCGILLKYYGFLMHMGAMSTHGEDRVWSSAGYETMFAKGFYGKR